MNQAIGAALANRREHILEDWLARVTPRLKARHLPRAQILNHVGALLDEVIDAVERPGRHADAAAPRTIAEEHGALRLDLGYGLVELGEEFNSLRESILAELDVAGLVLESTTAMALHGAIDRANRAAVERFIDLREERMRSRQSDFLARLAHDFRTPLAAVLGTTGLMRKQLGAASESMEKHLARIERASGRLLALIEGQLTTEQALSGAVAIHAREVDIGRLVSDTVDLFRERANAKGLALHLDVGQPVTAHTDPVLLGQVVQNFVDNAIKYTDAGEIAVAVRAERASVSIAVGDTGRGMPGALVPVIFDIYQRSEQISPGRGVGLAVVRSIATSLGAHVDVVSEEKRGSTFTVSLPRHAQA